MCSRFRYQVMVSLLKSKTVKRKSDGISDCSQVGVGLIEVLVTIIILAVGLLGLAALQGKSQRAEFESLQRSLALLLAEDMAERLRSAGSSAAANYEVEVGFQSNFSDLVSCDSSTATAVARDLSCWHRDLLNSDGDQSVGGLIGGHGCITPLDGALYRVSVSWQGLTPLDTDNPPEVDTCGGNLYSAKLLRTVNLIVGFYP